MFWGVFLAILGILFLLDNLNALIFDWYYIWQLWPLFFIFGGLALIIKYKPARAILSALSGLLAALLLFGLLNYGCADRDNSRWSDDTRTQTFEAPYTKNIKSATFALRGGGGKFYINGITDKLYDISTESPLSWYVVRDKVREKGKDSSQAYVECEMADSHGHIKIGKVKNIAKVKLNDNPEWNVEFETGVSKVDVDLSPLKTKRIKIQTGVSTIKIKVGNRTPDINLKVQCGVSSVRIEIPKTSGAEIRAETGLSGKSFEGCNKVEDGLYRSENFQSASNKIYIDINGGVSSFKVRRY